MEKVETESNNNRRDEETDEASRQLTMTVDVGAFVHSGFALVLSGSEESVCLKVKRDFCGSPTSAETDLERETLKSHLCCECATERNSEYGQMLHVNNGQTIEFMLISV